MNATNQGPHGPAETDYAFEEDDPRPFLAGIPQRYPMTAEEKHQAEPAAREGMCPEGF